MIGFFNSEEEFHAQRNKTVGSSDIPVLAGLTAKWDQTPYTLWEEKTGRATGFEGNEFTFWGKLHERNILYKYILDRFGQDIAIEWIQSVMHGENVVQSFDLDCAMNTFARHDEYEFAIAHADLFLAKGDHIQEAKSAKLYAAKRRDDLDYGYSGDDNSINGIPLAVYLQLQWQMMCYNAKTGGVSALIDTSDYREYGPCEPDLKTQEKLLALADRFMWHVTNDRPPKPETFNDVEKMFPRVEEKTIRFSPDYELKPGRTLMDMLRQRQALDEKSKEIEKQLKDIKTAVGLLMTDNKVLETTDGTILATVSQQTKESISLKDLEDQEPEIMKALEETELIKRTSFRKINFRKIKE